MSQARFGENQMRIKWYGTASLLVEGGDTRVLIDPYLKLYNKKPPPIPVEEATTAEAIFITHPHVDHFSQVGAFGGGNVKNIYVSQSGIDIARKMGFYSPKMIPLAANEEITVGDITVRTYRSRHCKFDAATVLGIAFNPLTYIHFSHAVALLKGMKDYKIANDDIYALELSCGGKRLMVLGSAGVDADTVYPQGADLLVLPYQGRTRMHEYTIPILNTFRPKTVMLDHFDNAFPPFTHNVSTKKFVPSVNKRFPDMDAFVPKEGEWYQI